MQKFKDEIDAHNAMEEQQSRDNFDPEGQVDWGSDARGGIFASQ